MSARNALDPLTHRLRAWGLHELMAAALEHAEPVAFLGAQLLYAAAPAAGVGGFATTLTTLANVLEDPPARQAWARQLTAAEGQSA